MIVRGIDHVGMTVPDLDAATEFFARAFGAEVLYDTLPRSKGPKGGWAIERRLGVPQGTVEVAVRMLRLPNGPGIELFEFSGPRQADAAVPCDLGWQHVAMYVDDVDETLRLIIEAGGTQLSEPGWLTGPEAGEHNRFVYCRTPWGGIVELVTYPDPQPYEKETDLRRWRP